MISGILSTKDFLMQILPTGKLPPELLEKMLNKIPILDKNVIVGPGTGLDCSVIDYGDQYLVLKSDPISLTSENIGWYAVQINVNDIVTTGADPKWMLITLLLPEKGTTDQIVESIIDQLIMSTKEYDITIIGGHTEITNGIDRPIISATLIGTVDKDKLITPSGIETGDMVFLTKEIAIETVSILSNDFPDKLSRYLTGLEIKNAQSYLYDPGISIYKEAHLIHLPCYIHTNPITLNYGGSTSIRSLENYKWSSFLDYIGRKNFPSVTNRTFILNMFGGEEGYRKYIEEWVAENKAKKHSELINDVLLE